MIPGTATLARLREKHLGAWVGAWAADAARRRLRRRPRGPRHLLFAICDHYEPLWGGAPPAQGLARVRAWSEGYAANLGAFRDADGRPPRHTFFFPGEQYAPEFLEPLAGLTRAGFGEVEVHLHHDGDSPEGMRRSLDRALEEFGRHGHVSRDGAGRPRWAFVHGNWCLANSRRDGRWCGVDAELPLLHEAGCYADFTFPSAPDETQPGVVNRIYWPVGDLARRGAYHRGERARVGVMHSDRLLLVQGPIALARRPGRLAVRIEAGALQAGDPPTPARIDTWVDQDVHVAGRPEWVFVKVHAHGAPERNAAQLLGPDGRRLHQHLSARYNDGRAWVLHYVTAREMYNVAVAAMEGASGDPGAYRDRTISPPPIVAATRAPGARSSPAGG
jgi:hypothetical protein